MLKHVSFVTPDAALIQAFYAQLGATLDKDVTAPDGLRRLVLLFPGGGRLQFWVTDRVQASIGASWLEHVAVELPDFDAVVARFKEQQVPFIREVQTLASGRRVAFVLDPDGRHVELLQAD